MTNSASLPSQPVTVSDTSATLPTYLPAAADPNPMFLEKRVYQGSSGRVYPLPFIDRIAEKSQPHDWRLIKLENDYLEVWILPEIGGRIHRMRDKTNGYDVIYYQPVIKPALVGLAGPWISGGIEFNWPQHHRPSTFMPAEADIEHEADGAVTVWLSEHDPMSRMKGMHGVRLSPGRAVLELRAQVHNRTDDVQTFLWWANVATEVHEHYQSFFPSDATFVADHAKRSMSTFPHCSGAYYGVDYAERARSGVPDGERPEQFRPDGSYAANDLSWYANIPVPTSYMCMGTREAFFGGYDHRARAGLVHWCNPHISPGKKQWTWGNHAFGYAWDRLLTDPDENGVHRPYIELMAGVYTDNQPDFSYLQPGETKTWSQYWYPIRKIGPVSQANADVAVRLSVDGGQAQFGIQATRLLKQSRISLHAGQTCLYSEELDLDPTAPLLEQVAVPEGTVEETLSLEILDTDGRSILRYSPEQPAEPPTPEDLDKIAAREPATPKEITSTDELYYTGLHLEQYRHATRCPTDWWKEALRRDPGDARCNLALGRWHLRRGEFQNAEDHLRRSIKRQTALNPNPPDGEALYQLGRTLLFLGREKEAYAAFYKASWNQGWAAAAFLSLARLDCREGNWRTALDHLERCLNLDTLSMSARTLKVAVLRKLKEDKAADRVLTESLSLDRLNMSLRQLTGEETICDNGIRLDIAFELGKAGLYSEALDVLDEADLDAGDGTVPMIHYTRAWFLDQEDCPEEAQAARAAARRSPHHYCFPSRLEEIPVLEAALTPDPNDARAHLFMGYLLYDRRRHVEAITHWAASVSHEPANAIPWRCLGIASFNVMGDAQKARHAFEMARAAAPDDARLLYEADQLARRTGETPQKRLAELEKRLDLVERRDDLTVELCALYNQTGQPEKALKRIASRQFQPWEGGEGQALGQHVRTHLQLGRKALEQKEAGKAVEHFESALTAPENRSEAKHLLANQSDIHFWLGLARHAAGDTEGATEAWKL
ncbi:MAG: DUF5107 domain-containing protein, partial [Puniceicoccaceae bacterium]